MYQINPIVDRLIAHAAKPENAVLLEIVDKLCSEMSYSRIEVHYKDLLESHVINFERDLNQLRLERDFARAQSAHAHQILIANNLKFKDKMESYEKLQSDYANHQKVLSHLNEALEKYRNIPNWLLRIFEKVV